MTLDHYGLCPECGANWDAGPIPEKYREHYAEPRRYSRLIGVYSIQRDMTVAWRCPDCLKEWPRDGVSP